MCEYVGSGSGINHLKENVIMARFFIIVCAIVGGFFGLALLSYKVPQITHTLFNVGSFPITGLIVGVGLVGIIAYKVTK